MIRDLELGGALAGKQYLFYCLGPNPGAGTNVHTSRCWVICGNSGNCKQITAMPRRSICHAAKSSRMQYTAKMKTINNYDNQTTNPLELRLVSEIAEVLVSKRPNRFLPCLCTLSTARSAKVCSNCLGFAAARSCGSNTGTGLKQPLFSASAIA